MTLYEPVLQTLQPKDIYNEKILPYESFLMHRESFDHDDFCTALHIRIKDKYSCYFMCPFIKIILTDLWIIQLFVQSATSKIYTSSCDQLGYPQVGKYYFYEWTHEIT